MNVVALHDPRDFLARAGPLLAADEARHNLMFGVCQTLIDVPDLYRAFHLWVVEEAEQTLGAAVMTPPYNLLLARPLGEGVLDALARELHGSGVAVPGVVAAAPEVEEFVDVWMSVTSIRAERVLAQGIYQVSEVRPISSISGSARPATPADRDLVMRWILEFAEEALPEAERDPGRFERNVDARLEGRSGGFHLWEDDGAAVSMAGHGGETPNGVRIGPVYTPPAMRGRGYAGALVSTVSAQLLEAGRTFCFLYTDLSNPISNRLYVRIGYEFVCESAEYSFLG